jgi:lipid-binding SYLF domain-containing protein
MKNQASFMRALFYVATLVIGVAVLDPARAASREEIDKGVIEALKSLYATTPAAKALGDKAKAVLVFPSVLKAGLVVGGQGGDGALLKGGKTVAYYNTAAASIGLQAGAQKFGYALFFMSDAVVKDFESSKGFEIGVGPTVVFVDEGAAKDVNTLTGKADVFGFIFGQTGLMAGIGLQGSKITKIER